MTDIRVYADNQDFGNAVALYFTRHKNDGSFEVLGASGFKDYLPNFLVLPSDAITIKRDAAQELMDRLWTCGLRPSEGTGSAGQASAMHNNNFSNLRRGQVFLPER